MAEVKKVLETKQEQAKAGKQEQAKAGKQEQAKAGKQAGKQEQAKATPKDGEILIIKVSAKTTAILTTDESGKPAIANQINVTAQEVKKSLPKTLKAGAQESAEQIICAKVLQAQREQAQSRKAQEQAKDEPNKDIINECKAIDKQITAELKKLKLSGEQAKSIKNPMAELLATFWSSGTLSIELKNILTSLQELENITNGTLLKYYAGEQIQANKEEREKITACKQAIKETLSYYTAENELFNTFKLSVSDADLIAFYRATYTEKGAQAVSLLTDKNRKAFIKVLVSWLLRKMQATDK